MKESGDWPRPRLNPLPQRTGSLDFPTISLNGDAWKLNPSPGENFYDLSVDFSDWQDTVVPLQVDMGENEYAYTRILHIPEEWRQNRIFLRFDGANCYSRVFIDGVYICDHYGGFVSWDCDITHHVTPGKEHRLVIGITDKPREVNPFHRGGLIRDVTLYTLPETYLARLHADTTFNRNFTDAVLTIHAMLGGSNGTVKLKLIFPTGQETVLSSLTGEPECDLTGHYCIQSPLKWDSEHPYLYTLQAYVIVDDVCTEVVTRKIGFRQIERRGNQVFINGDLLKLRGINRHDIHPLTGRAISYELVEEDVRLFKEANINFIRTSHYPPRPDFLDLCDQYGIYVEDEIAVSFLGYSCWHTENDPVYTQCFIGQFSEMIERDRSHPSVIIWSLANESCWGENIAMMNSYAHREDPSRLTVFSYPLTQMDDDEPVDIWSYHYAGIDANLEALTEAFQRSNHEPAPMPVIHDESTHIPCYNFSELKRDPGTRDFWGETIKRFWDRIWDTEGALGCAIWAGIDDVRVKDGAMTRYPWGIMDGWRRLKPEYWHTRKGYSPIRILGEPRAQDCSTVVPVRNWFNHTNLHEIRISWKLGNASGKVQGPDIPPRGEGLLIIPSLYLSGEILELTFTDSFGFQVDEASYHLNTTKPQLPVLTGGEPCMEQGEEFLQVSGNDFCLIFSKETGLITEGYYQNILVLTGGPALNLTGLDLEPWQLKHMDARIIAGYAQITLEGFYGKVEVHFTIRIDANGLMETTYTFTDMPYHSPRKIAISSSIASHCGGYDEVGIYYTVPAGLDILSWEKTGLWSIYPNWHISRLEGATPKFNPVGINPADKNPGWGWQMDEKDWTLFGKYDIGRRGTRDFASMKPSILHASLKQDNAAFTALSDGSDAVRMELTFNPSNIISDRDPAVVYHGNWQRQDNRSKSLGGTETWSGTKGDTCQYTFTGTGIAWISSLDKICGIARVYIDGELKDDRVDLGSRGKNARRYKKYYRSLVYSIEDLPWGEHTIRIEVTGEKAPESNGSYVIIDHFIVLDGKEIGDTKFIINSEFNYPELSWGCYSKPPIIVSTGYTRRIYTKLGSKE
jgi:beta-galactosidase